MLNATSVKNTLTDQFGRTHDYLRISLTEMCNLRCFYCMPPNGIELSPTKNLMTAEEVFNIASVFVKLGVKKIRLTGGEPLVRKDLDELLKKIASLPVELAITTNGVLIDKKIELFRQYGIQKVNVSLDTLSEQKFEKITYRNYYQRIRNNIELLVDQNFNTKLNVVVIKGVNDDEIIDFIKLTEHKKIGIQFIEFMPFKGNKWNKDKTLSSKEILHLINVSYGKDRIEKVYDSPNDTSVKHRIKNALGYFGVVATVTNPFCDSCNRIRLTATGTIKNCLFSRSETDLLTSLRKGIDIENIIHQNTYHKLKKRSGLNFFDKNGLTLAENNRTMVAIGG